MVLQAMRERAAELGRVPGVRDWRGPWCAATVRRLFGSWPAAVEAAGLEPVYRRGRCVFCGAEIRNAVVTRLRELSQELGRTPRVTDWRGPVGIAAVLREFGSWNAAVRAAGLAPNRERLRRARRNRSDQELLDSLRRLAPHLGRRPAVADLGTELAVKLGCPSPRTLVLRFGGWRAALEAAGLDGMPRKKDMRRRLAEERAAKLARLGFVLSHEVREAEVRKALKRKGVPIVQVRKAQFEVLAVADWLRGCPALGMLPSAAEVWGALGPRAAAFWWLWTRGVTLSEIAAQVGLTRERVRQIVTGGARRAVWRLLAGHGPAEGLVPEPAAAPAGAVRATIPAAAETL